MHCLNKEFSMVQETLNRCEIKFRPTSLHYSARPLSSITWNDTRVYTHAQHHHYHCWMHNRHLWRSWDIILIIVGVRDWRCGIDLCPRGRKMPMKLECPFVHISKACREWVMFESKFSLLRWTREPRVSQSTVACLPCHAGQFWPIFHNLLCLSLIARRPFLIWT